MIIILSPAKTLDFSRKGNDSLFSTVEFPGKAKQIASMLSKYSASDLMSLMGISSRLAYLNYERYQEWSLNEDPAIARQAILAYKGDVYNGLDAHSLNDDDLRWSQEHLRILSGLYGMLRPLDLIMPYRLEFATKLKINKYNDLYEYWEKHINSSLESLIQTEKSGLLINLASNEYSKVLHLKRKNLRIITPIFKEYRNGEYRFLSMFGKKARGMMARFIIQGRISDPEELKLFGDEGYSFNEPLSKSDEWVFTR